MNAVTFKNETEPYPKEAKGNESEKVIVTIKVSIIDTIHVTLELVPILFTFFVRKNDTV